MKEKIKDTLVEDILEEGLYPVSEPNFEVVTRIAISKTAKAIFEDLETTHIFHDVVKGGLVHCYMPKHFEEVKKKWCE